MAYRVGNIPSDAPAWLVQELRKLQEAAFAPVDFLQLNVLNVAPTKPRDGMVIFADGVNLNPGSGKGVYVYKSGAWSYLG